MDTPPPIARCEQAVERAAAARRATYRADPAYAGVTGSALAERVVGLPGKPRRGREGWWWIGEIVDAIADEALDIWYQPQRLAVSRRTRSEVHAPSPTIVPDNGWAPGWRSKLP